MNKEDRLKEIVGDDKPNRNSRFKKIIARGPRKKNYVGLSLTTEKYKRFRLLCDMHYVTPSEAMDAIISDVISRYTKKIDDYKKKRESDFEVTE